MLVQQILNGFYANTDANRYYRQVETLQNAINQFSLTLFKKLSGNLADYRLNAPVARMQFKETADIETQLLPFYRTIEGATTLGIVDLTRQPFSISSIETIRIAYSGGALTRPLKMWPDNQYYDAVTSRVHPPTQDYPYGNSIGVNKVEFTPSAGATSFQARVLVYPANCVLVSTDQISPSGVPILDSERTIDLEWDEGMADTFVNGIMGILGINMANGMVAQIGNAKQNQDL